MKQAGLGAYYVTDVYLEMQAEAEKIRPNKNKIINYSTAISTAKETALYIQDFIVVKQQEITEFEQISGLNATSAWILLDKAKTELEYERYDNAKEALSKITSTLDQIQVDASRLLTQVYAGTNRFFEWVWNNVIWIILFLIITAGISYVSYKKMDVLLLNRKISNLEIEKEVLADLLKRSQTEYYTEQKITKNTYNLKKEMYKKRTEEIKSLLPVLCKEVQKKIEKGYFY